jgi:hypothetical protein
MDNDENEDLAKHLALIEPLLVDLHDAWDAADRI